VAAKDGVELAMAASARPLFEQSVEEGHGNQDLSTVVEALHNDR
jgi:3-hydroxyisobutyrate dehydrogenase-like beta-hydroxyacid dehydrogenase